MIVGCLTAKDVAEKWRIPHRRVQILCLEGKIPGEMHIGHDGAMPDDVERPNDGRITTGKYKDVAKEVFKSRFRATGDVHLK